MHQYSLAIWGGCVTRRSIRAPRVLGAGTPLRRGQKAVTVQDLYYGQVRVSGPILNIHFLPGWRFVLIYDSFISWNI